VGKGGCPYDFAWKKKEGLKRINSNEVILEKYGIWKSSVSR
jgi:hypothetical protein